MPDRGLVWFLQAADGGDDRVCDLNALRERGDEGFGEVAEEDVLDDRAANSDAETLDGAM